MAPRGTRLERLIGVLVANEESTSTEALVQNILSDIFQLNVSQGIENSLDEKLNNALMALDDVNEQNDVAAVNSLYALINSVNAQRGNKISEADADALILSVTELINFIVGS